MAAESSNSKNKPLPHCFLTGFVTKKTTKTPKPENATIRLRFEAMTADECKTQFEAYCFTAIQKDGWEIQKLGGSFVDRSSDGKTNRTEFVVQRDCSAQRVVKSSVRNSN